MPWIQEKTVNANVASPTEVPDDLDHLIAQFVKNPEHRANPLPFIARLQAEAPVRWVPELDSWFVSSREGIESLTSDSRWSVERANWSSDEGGSDSWGLARRLQQTMILFRDGPDHARMRRVISPSLTPGKSEEWRERFAAKVDQLLKQVADRETIDLAMDFGYPLALWTVCQLLGLPDEAGPKILDWTDDYVKIFQPVLADGDEERANAVIAEMRSYLQPWLEKGRRGESGNNLIGLFAAAEKAGKLEGDEAIAYTLMMSISAYDTSANLVALALFYLLQHKEQWRQVVEDPSLATNALEEVMRYDNSVWNVMPRYALEDIELAGQMIHKGDRALSLLVGSGHNREHFEDPDTFDISRANARDHHGFGGGSHICSGQWLARVEVQEAIRGFARQYPDADVIETELSWRPTFGGRNPVSTKVNLRAVTHAS